MVDTLLYSKAQKMSWMKQFFDENYMSSWKSIELETLKKFQ